MIVFNALLTIYLVQSCVGLLLVIAYYKKDKSAERDKIKQVSVVVPFKNEEHRITPLLKSILAVDFPKGLDVEFVFVDDKSSDNSQLLIREYLKDQVVLLNNKGNGKKTAIQTGVEQAKYTYVLTLDADVSISSEYFSALSNLNEADLWILPVRLMGNKLIQRLGAIEFGWLQMLGIGMAKQQHPFLCNGANLMFNKKVFLDLDKKRTDYEIASGDDMFLLEAMQKTKATIQATSAIELMAYSKGPESFSALRLQRSRWINKMKGRSTLRDFLLASFQAVFVGSMFLVFFQLDFLPWIFLPLGLKVLNEFLLQQSEKRFKEPIIDFFIVLLHQLWYVVYLVAMIIPSRREESRWAKL